MRVESSLDISALRANLPGAVEAAQTEATVAVAVGDPGEASA
jgi:hypothetical protein